VILKLRESFYHGYIELSLSNTKRVIRGSQYKLLKIYAEVLRKSILELRSVKVNGLCAKFWDYYIDTKKMSYTRINIQV